MANSLELREKRATLVNESRHILDASEKEKRPLHADEKEKWDRAVSMIEQLKTEIDTVERQEHQAALEREQVAIQARKSYVPTQLGVPTMRKYSRAQAFRAWATAGTDFGRTSDDLAAAEEWGINVNSPSFTLRINPTAMHTRDLGDTNANSATAIAGGTAGGWVHQEYSNIFETALKFYGGMRDVATVIRTDKGGDLPIPTENDTSNSGVILGESGSDSEQDPSTGQTTLKGYKFTSKIVKISIELAQDSAINVQDYILEKLAIRLGRGQNTKFTVGVGSTEPTGILTAATAGVTSAGNTLAFTDVLNLKNSVDWAYQRRGRYMFHQSLLNQLLQLVDNNNRPLFLPGYGPMGAVAVGAPDTLFGQPYVINNDFPSWGTSTSSSSGNPSNGQEVILYGDLSKYVIRDVLDITITRLDQLYAASHQLGYVAIMRADGNLLDAGTHPCKFLTMA